jgi:hypothetical protein
MFYEVTLCNHFLYAQVKSNNEFWKWTTWAVLQGIPSITFYEDRDQNNSWAKFGLQWQVIPISYTFHVNKYLSNYNFFFIRPVKRFSGSVELFFEPDYITGDFKYSDLKKFMFQSGTRVVLPVAQGGEYLSFSLGAGYYYQKSNTTGVNDGMTYEGAVYSFYGMLGLKFNYNVNAPSRYGISLYIKYY